jgi:HAE1 family hydrophobic/amphiphilic exporter-1
MTKGGESSTATARGTWPRVSIDRPVAAFMLIVAVVVFGWVSLQQLPVNLMPELSYPTLTVRTEYPGAAPEEVEDEITDRIEELVGTVEGVVLVTSVSRAGGADVQMQFGWGTNLDLASQKVRERIALIDFPDAADPPLILRFDPTLDPIMRIALTGGSGPRALRRYGVDELQPAIEKLEGVAMVRVLGGEEEVVRVSVDEGRLQTLGLEITAISDRLRNENVNVAGGVLYDGESEFLIRTLNEFSNLQEMRDLVVTSRNGQSVRLGDIARVERDVREVTALTRVDGQPSIELAVFKEADANLVEVAEAVKRLLYGATMAVAAEGSGSEGSAEEVPEAQAARGPGAPDAGSDGGIAAEAPEGVRLIVLTDQSTYIRDAIAEVGNTALYGGLCAIVVLFLFLRSGWMTLIIGLAIPLSVVATFAPLRMMGVSLNIMSLGGLALGIGMLVDNAVVVLESIYRYREQGMDPRQAAIVGTSEVGPAVTASTLTTVAVFLPITFVEGIAGQLFTDLALTVVLSLLASLVQALFVVPMMTVLPWRITKAAGDPGSESDPGMRLRPTIVWQSWQDTLGDARSLRRWWSEGGVLRRVAVVIPLVLLWLLLAVRTVVALVVETAGKLASLALLGLAFVARWVAIGTVFVLTTALKPLTWSFGRALDGLTWGYERLLRVSLKASPLVIIASGLLTWWAWVTYPSLGTQLIPELHQGEFTAIVRFPIGTRLEETSDAVASLETEVAGVAHVRQVASFIGRDEENVDTSDQGEHYAEVTVSLESEGDPAEREEAAMAAVRDILARVPGASFEVVRPVLFSLSAPVTVEIRGWNLEGLQQSSDAVSDLLESVDGVEDVRNTMGRGYPEVRVVFDRERLSSFGIEVRDAAETIRRKVQGEVATRIRQDARRVDVEVALRESDVSAVEDLRALVIGQGRRSTTADPVAAAAGTMQNTQASLSGNSIGARNAQTETSLSATSAGQGVRLDAVATLVVAEGPAEIRHIDGARAATVEAGTSLLDLGGVSERIQTGLSGLALRPGQSVSLSGQADELAGAQRNLLFALALAIFLVYVVMASTFESLIGPMVILLTVPLAAVGVVGVMKWTGTPVSAVAFIGVIVLAGIVVNNAIVLVDTIIERRRRGLERDAAIIEACTIRLRPVLITTTTTVLGLLPMVLETGEGAEIRQPLALVVTAGLGASTLLTLIVIPVVYRMVGEIAGAPAVVGNQDASVVVEPEVEDAPGGLEPGVEG